MAKRKPKKPDMKRCRLVVEVEYDANVTDDESLCTALDNLMTTAYSTPGILDEYGNPTIFEFLPEGCHEAYEKTLAGPGVDPTKSLRWQSDKPNLTAMPKDRETDEAIRVEKGPLTAIGHMTDEANPSEPSLQFKVQQEVYGISVAAFGDTGHQLGEVLLDYNGNRLQAHCYHPDVDDPASSFMFCDDVKTARKGKKED